MSKHGVIIRRIDGNQSKIVKDLRADGFGVLDIHIIGNGAPDLVVSNTFRTVLVEVKDIGGSYTPDELEWAQKWPGDVITAFSARDVKAWFADRKNLSN